MQPRFRPSATDPTHEENWHGGFYELTIKLGPADDERLDTALTALWDAASLPAPLRRTPGHSAEVCGAALLTGQLHSVATIPGLGSTLCSVMVVREESCPPGATRLGADWLDLCLPLGALGNLDDRVGGYPFDDQGTSRGWRETIESWFATVAAAVFEAAPYLHAITGHEVSGMEPSEVEGGHFAVFRPGSDGSLVREPVRTWFWP